MNESDGVVVRVESGYAWVRAAGPGHACGACASRPACAAGGGVLDASGEARLLRLPNAIGARVGDAVVIRAADGSVLRAIWSAYVIPLALALLGAIVLLQIAGSEGAAVAGTVLGLLAGFVMLRRKRQMAAGEHMLSIVFKRDFPHH